MQAARVWLVVAGVLGASGVAMGAYASHGLGFIADEVVREASRATLQAAVQQQMVHALALLAIACWSFRTQSRALQFAGVLFTAGILLFSGLIYLRILGSVDSLRALVPWGGSCLIAGWLTVLVAGIVGFKPR